MPNVEETVDKMLHNKNTILRHDKFFLKGNLQIREQLSAEIFNKVENGSKKENEIQSPNREVLPFPYRIAKALDPNIYRNTDLDIWHEIRREVKNAGWNRHNGNELQVGGKCLIQINYADIKHGKSNNNNTHLQTAQDENDNNLKQKEAQEDPVFYCGHIQEMTKNEGPVLVFIEELGEKRFMPYSALKPFPLKKNKQTNWTPINRKSPMLPDSNQKWKRNYCNWTRKGEDSANNPNNESYNGIKSNVNDINDNKKGNFGNNQWTEPPFNRDYQKAAENYHLENYPNHPINDANQAPLTPDKFQTQLTKNVQKVIEENTENAQSDTRYNNGSNDNAGNNINQQLKCPVPYVSNHFGEIPFSNQMDRMLRSINCSAQKSMDVNGSDLPLSDPLTLRFFYNLGLEYFHVTRTWQYQANGQSLPFGSLYNVHVEKSIMSIDNNGNETTMQQMTPNGLTSCENGLQNIHIERKENQKNQNEQNSCVSHEKPKKQINNKDTQRTNKNVLPPRFKKNYENRHRNVYQQGRLSQSNHANQSPQQIYHLNDTNSQDVKNENAQVQYSSPVLQQAYISSYQNTYQAMYGNIPVYSNDAETLGSAYYFNAGYFPVPYVPHTDATEGNNCHSPCLQFYSGAENYVHTCATVCAPCTCSQQAFYPPVSPQNTTEHWYGFQGQPQYAPYGQMQQNASGEVVCNGANQSIGQNGLP